MFDSMNVSSSALTMQRLRMDVASSNIANADTTRAELVNGEWQPYQRKMVVQQSQSFSSHLNRAKEQLNEGVVATGIVNDQTPSSLIYDPTHPDANDLGYVAKPNVDIAREMVDMTSATRSYEANVTALQASKNMLMKSLEIGR
ncbi:MULTISPECIES: flagellar basal body rod protein FlgC [Shouchella]|uniref:Flagellar basal-body rod protein FlgC n=2 Tax=Shouchella TaxID=2893057 RepID=A0ABY7W7D5_9BACI|nr:MULTISPECIES: flagellar basal body rod protein FlgC [Shouchella]MED4127300.1 flagellar basal body rod protein FlgC [Shouchella miscanthi]WDF03775.1 flagellar basal body rod protein FlgC [Shouchella hunanensis]GAF23354.1 flagellar basal-body rod protein FlgC [Bacillus sp. JCM 19047]